MLTLPERAEIKRASSVMTPADGVTIQQALSDAQLDGFQRLDVDLERNEATITWHDSQLVRCPSCQQRPWLMHTHTFAKEIDL